MAMGIKGVQITGMMLHSIKYMVIVVELLLLLLSSGSDGLRYTQSMGYLQEKIPVQTQTQEADFRNFNRSAKTAPAGHSFPPLSSKSRSLSSQNARNGIC